MRSMNSLNEEITKSMNPTIMSNYDGIWMKTIAQPVFVKELTNQHSVQHQISDYDPTMCISHGY